LGNYPAAGFYMPTFRNTLCSICLWRWNSVPKRRHIKSRCRVITQKKAYNIQNTAKAWNQEEVSSTAVLFGKNSVMSILKRCICWNS